mmetsp:Transcript_32056/g.60367  ORF Transcript_32056/g.60367 Transcript_32056/m.60367 type:complete len:85 (-) Transcript_32056:78-332(-)
MCGVCKALVAVLQPFAAHSSNLCTVLLLVPACNFQSLHLYKKTGAVFDESVLFALASQRVCAWHGGAKAQALDCCIGVCNVGMS